MSPLDQTIDPAEVLDSEASFRSTFWAILTIATGTYVAAAGLLRWMTWSSGRTGPVAVVSIDFGGAMTAQGTLAGLIVAVNVLTWSWRTARPEARTYAQARTMSVAAVFVGFASVFATLGYVVSLFPGNIRLVELATIITVSAVIVAIAGHTTRGLEDGSLLQREVVRVGAQLAIDALEMERLRHLEYALPKGIAVRRTVTRLILVSVLAAGPAGVYVASRGANQDLMDRVLGAGAMSLLGCGSSVLAGGVIYALLRGRTAKDYFVIVLGIGFGAATYLSLALVVAFLATQPGASTWKHWVFAPSIGWMVLVPVVAVWLESTRTRSVMRAWLLRAICSAIERETVKRDASSQE